MVLKTPSFLKVVLTTAPSAIDSILSIVSTLPVLAKTAVPGCVFTSANTGICSPPADLETQITSGLLLNTVVLRFLLYLSAKYFAASGY